MRILSRQAEGRSFEAEAAASTKARLGARIRPMMQGRPGRPEGSTVDEARELGEALWPMTLCRKELTQQI